MDMKATMRVIIEIDYDGEETIETISEHLENMMEENMNRLEDEGLLSGDLDTSAENWKVNVDAIHCNQECIK